MSILQFLRILLARKWLILGATLSCVLGAALVIKLVPPRWTSESRVILDILKPDPVTGLVIAGPATRGYVATQTQLLTDYSVAGQVVDQLGWLSDPRLISAYQRRPKSDGREFRRWLADIVINSTSAKLLEGSNIISIKLSANNARNARLLADAVRKAYMDTSLATRRDDATRNAEWYEQQAAKSKAELDAAQEAKITYERTNGILMQDDKTDIDTARLRALVAQGAGMAPPSPITSTTASPVLLQLTQLESEIAQSEQTLGPNHPQLKALKAKRDSLAAMVAKDQGARSDAKAAADAAAAGQSALDKALQAQKARVISEHDKLNVLQELQTNVELKTDQYNKSIGRAAQLRQEASASDAGISALGNATTPSSPVFPNIPLIVGGSLGLGLAIGVMVALLIELFGRRIRGVEDMRLATSAPVLAAIPAKHTPRRSTSKAKSGAPLPLGKAAQA